VRAEVGWVLELICEKAAGLRGGALRPIDHVVGVRNADRPHALHHATCASG